MSITTSLLVRIIHERRACGISADDRPCLPYRSQITDIVTKADRRVVDTEHRLLLAIQ